MKKVFLFLLGFYLLFSLFVDFAVLKQRSFLADEASHLLPLISLQRKGSLSINLEDVRGLYRYYFFGVKGVSLVRRERIYAFSPWIYSYLAYPFFHLFGERGLYLLNFLFLLLVFWLATRFEREYHFPSFLLFLLASVSWLYFFLEGPYLMQFVLGLLSLYLFMKNKFLYASYFMGLLAFLNPVIFFLVPVFGFIAAGKKPFFGIYFTFKTYLLSFLLIALALLLGGSLPWEKPFIMNDFKAVESFFKEPALNQTLLCTAAWGENFLYFLFGRFSGVFLYFPPLIFIPFLLRKKELPLAFLTAGLLAIFVLFAGNNFSPSFYLGNPLLLGVYPFAYYLFSRSHRSFALVLSLFLLSYFLFMPLRNLKNPLMHSQIFPFHLFPVELSALDRLPAYKVGDRYHFDLNFYFYKKGNFWTRGNSRVEFVALMDSSKAVVEITNSKTPNEIFIKVNRARKRVSLKPAAKTKVLTGSSKKYKGKWIFHIKVKCRYSEVKLPDKLALGVNVNVRGIHD